MAIKEIRTFGDIIDGIIRRASLEDKESVRDDLKEKINTAYQFVGVEKSYRWSGETLPITMPAKYSTGTVALTNGSDLVTGTSTAWTQFLHEGRKFYVVGVNRPFKILRVSASDQVITLDSPWTGTTQSAATYSIFKDEFGLFPDCQDVRKVWVPGRSTNDQPLPCGTEEMDSIRALQPFRAGSPIRYTINGYNIYTAKTWATFNLNTDFWEDSYDAYPRNLNLVMWPSIPSVDTVAMVRYSKLLPPMVNEDEEPIMPYEVRPRLMYEVLIDHFITKRDSATKREWKEKRDEFKRMMAGDIETTDDELILTVDRTKFSRQSMIGLDGYRDSET